MKKTTKAKDGLAAQPLKDRCGVIDIRISFAATSNTSSGLNESNRRVRRLSAYEHSPPAEVGVSQSMPMMSINSHPDILYRLHPDAEASRCLQYNQGRVVGCSALTPARLEEPSTGRPTRSANGRSI